MRRSGYDVRNMLVLGTCNSYFGQQKDAWGPRTHLLCAVTPFLQPFHSALLCALQYKVNNWLEVKPHWKMDYFMPEVEG